MNDELAELDESDELFVFNGIDGATGHYLVPPMTAHQIVALAQGKAPDDVQREAMSRHEAASLADYAPREDVDPKSLAESGWGVVFAHDEDPAVIEALQPLLEHRKATAASLEPGRYREFKGPAGHRPGEGKAAFLGRHKAPTSGPVDPDRMPYYLLLVGSAARIPCEFQAQLDLQHAVGRLWFATPDEYDAYARSVIASETGQVKVSRRMGLFGPQNPDDRATELSATGLLANLERYVQKKCPAWSLDVRTAEAATKAALAEVLGGSSTPAVLFTASHGMSFPLGDARQLPHQGALLCQDWAGPRDHSGPIPPELYFSADDLGDSARLAGLIAFCFACYGGGTPERDAFFHASGDAPKPIAPHAFFSRLPLRMLSHPRGGALAVVAHVERAWGCSFYSAKSGHQTAVFEGFAKRLLDGHPVGSALDGFGMRYGELSSGLLEKLQSMSYGDTSISEVELANDWTANNDARNYIVLGDPAVRVPAVDDAQAIERPALELRSAPTTVTATTVTATTTTVTTAGATLEAAQAPVPFGLPGWLGGRGKDDVEPGKDGPEPEPESFGAGDALRGFVSKLGEKISQALDDLTSLEVRTYVARDMAKVGVTKENQLLGAELRAYTRISFDGDTSVCVPERDGEVDTALFDIHLRMVEQAQAARAELLKTIVQAAASLAGLGK
jgi:hypothetical protein